MLSRPIVWRGRPVHSWTEFHDVVKQPDQPLLARLDDYDDSVLVAGCQRSGTTALARLLKRAKGIADHGFGADDELDGALLLAGYVARLTDGRHCFQTTYLNDRYTEYFEHASFRLIWMLREPRSAVHSMLRNWKRSSATRAVDDCATSTLAAVSAPRTLLGSWGGPSRLDKACASYVARTEQTFALRERLGQRMAVVDYDDLVVHRDALLPQLCEFAEIPYDPELTRHSHGKSARKGDRLAAWEARHVDDLCDEVYRKARALRTIRAEYGDERK
jgi:hypothetical protein